MIFGTHSLVVRVGKNVGPVDEPARLYEVRWREAEPDTAPDTRYGANAQTCL